jgi:hypothetical protein
MEPFNKISLNHYKGIILSFLVFIITSANLLAQVEVETAKQYLVTNASKYNLTDSNIGEMAVSSAYLSPTTGWYHVYFNQTYQGIDVYNGLLNLVLKQNQVQYVANNFVPNITSQINSNSSLMGIKYNPKQALQQVLTHLKITSSNLSGIQEISNDKLANGMTDRVLYQDIDLSNENIEVKLFWLPYKSNEETRIKGKSGLVLSWSVRFSTKDNLNKWAIHVDATTGEILQQRDEVIHCNFGTSNHLETPHICTENSISNSAKNSSTLAANNYSVFDYPFESPLHGSRSVVDSPYIRFAPTGAGPGTTNGWHNDGTTDFTTTRGNNVWAQEDTNNNDGTGLSPVSSILDFNFPYTKAISTASGNQNAAITNLFYWNNLIHDVLWRYGFDEPSGNFQNNNQGRGGAGNDYVFADAQDGGGTNNADFSSPVDGSNGRMQMYLWSNVGSPAYQPDGDFDNGIIAHEYGHGWSTRLTGGPANSSCLDNVEQGGEGWSDYAALMFTTNWSALTPTIASANIARGIGTYAIGQATTGGGIRPYRYSYDMVNVNGPVTYAKVGNSSFSEPHGIGSIWATILWDMTWAMIIEDNIIVNNIYDTPTNITDMKGNIAAFKLVNEGLRLQKCSPSFVDARNAIMKADTLLFNARYSCAIGKAFARRGLGVGASTGASSNDRIVTESFVPFGGNILSSATEITTCSNNVFTYNATSATPATSFTWVRPAVAGISNSAGSGSSGNISETLINTTSQAVTVIYTFSLTPNNTACNVINIPQPVSVKVLPLVVPTVGAYSICQNSTVPSGQGLVVPNPVSNSASGTLTSTSPTYMNGQGDNTTVYSPSGRTVYYKTYSFVASANGSVTFEIIAANLIDGGDDSYLSLYQTSFNPLSPETNFLRGDDDSGIGFLSLLSHPLVQNTTYIVVVSSYNSLDTGTFTLQTSSPIFSNTLNWYKNPVGGTVLATGGIFNPVGIAGTGIANTATSGSTNFYVSDALNPNCRTTVTFTIDSLTVGGSTTGGTNVCFSGNRTKLILSGNVGDILKWQSSPTSTFTTFTDINNTTDSLIITNLTQSAYYRAVVKKGTCLVANSSSTNITVINPTVTGTMRADSLICYNTTTSLSVTYSSGTIKWYDATGLILLGSGSPFITPQLMGNTTFKARCDTLGCNSVFAPITVSVIPMIASPIVQNDTTIALSSSITLTASGCSGIGATLNWYKSVDSTLVTMPVTPADTTKYFVKCKQINGSLACSSIKSNDVTINVIPYIISIATGDWESATTWNLGRVPQTGDFVIIAENHIVILHSESSIKAIEYRGSGMIQYHSSSSKLHLGL